MPVRRLARSPWTVRILGAVLFLAALAFVVAFTLPGDFLLSVVRPAFHQRGMELEARDARLSLPIGIRLSDVSITREGNPPLRFDEAIITWEWTGLLRWLPARLRLVRGDAAADLRFSPAFWAPSGGTVSLSGIESADIPFPVFSSSRASFGIRRIDAVWKLEGGKVRAEGSGTLRFLQIPVPAADSPIREARIENVDLAFMVRGDAIRVPRITGTYEGSRLDGTGEVSGFTGPGAARVTFHLRIQNPREGRVAAMFNMMAKNAKNANLRIVGTLTAPTGEFQFF